MRRTIVPTVLLCLTVPLSLAAQEEQATEAYVYATYFYCDTTTEDAADEFVKNKMAPGYDAAVAAGQMTAWGWLAHHTGGKWRRVIYRSSTSLAGAIGTLDVELEGVADDDPGVAVSCKAHDDYIWKSEAGSGPGNRGEVGESVYFVCNMNKEERADELVATQFAPIYNKHLEDGKIASWGWQSHVIGGEYRRLLTITAADVASLLSARESLLAAVGEVEGSSEFIDICYSHTDYLWEVRHETP
jgi:hypothetical protein